MKIEIGDKNKIENSVIGNDNKILEKKENKIVKIIIEIIIGIIIAGIVFWLGWN